MGAVRSIGVGLDAYWRGIAAGHTGIRAGLRFATEAYAVNLGASLDATALPAGIFDPDPDPDPDPDHHAAIDPCAAIAIVAASQREGSRRGADRRPAVRCLAARLFL